MTNDTSTDTSNTTERDLDTTIWEGLTDATVEPSAIEARIGKWLVIKLSRSPAVASAAVSLLALLAIAVAAWQNTPWYAYQAAFGGQLIALLSIYIHVNQGRESPRLQA
ncbi:hypothetical protein [Engelhardtia mirabilis]|uniref:Uncharacterized protein n=1 Tax=Engelhardtia mirabilis TaxID=2528011 RepID=A0A518BT39_9BACT|nr:hypothetical protein Pla133_52650 [Planctomycetes bacterium Pla133]